MKVLKLLHLKYEKKRAKMEILINKKVIFHFKISQQDISFDILLFILRMKPDDIQLFLH